MANFIFPLCGKKIKHRCSIGIMLGGEKMEELRKKTKISGFALEVLDILRTVIICVIGVFICTTVLFKPVKIEGDSMKPTLLNGEYGFSNVFSILGENFDRFDVVVVEHEEDNSMWVKRIIALPNETIEYKDGKLYIDGEYVEEYFLDEAYIAEVTNDGMIDFTHDFGPIQLQADEVFLMGDNRLVSHDSRAVGPFKIKDLVSKSVLVYYPFQRMGLVNNGK